MLLAMYFEIALNYYNTIFSVLTIIIAMWNMKSLSSSSSLSCIMHTKFYYISTTFSLQQKA